MQDTSKEIKHVLIIGSGPIIIGQACEFDYSGSQAAKSLREEGVKVSLINSNPATIMTDEIMADQVYLLPLEISSIEKILSSNLDLDLLSGLPKIDSVLPTMGGQTALNLAIECHETGVWEKYGVKMIGVDVEAIKKTEDRELFRSLMEEINIPCAPAQIAKSFLEGKEVAQKFGFPLVIRPSFTLGGTGGAVVLEEKDFDDALNRGLHSSPVHEVLIDKALLGWKEYELELLRDKDDNVIIVCSIENFDPMGIHTGDSITVAPAMTLSDKTYQRMRDSAIKMMRAIGNFAGGCNVQFAVSPDEKEDIIAVEINPRVSRSSALASKATGYPIASLATKLALGKTLTDLKNPMTKNTSACFEPALDYVVVKIPRWNFDKFKGSNKVLGFQMKSVGEVMSIGRSFQEAFNKAIQSLEINKEGFSSTGIDLKSDNALEEIERNLKHATHERVFWIYDAFRYGLGLKRIQELTKIDFWFLHQLEELIKIEDDVKNSQNFDLRTLKKVGFSDKQIAKMRSLTEYDIYKIRKNNNILPSYKRVDTCAAEFDAPSNYFYSTYDNENESIVSNKEKVVVIGSGPNRIGQGIEFDYCCVHGILAAKEMGYETIMINCNPETVSTDYTIADKLYFEPLDFEHVRSVLDLEKPKHVIVQLGGQTALKLAKQLHEYGYPISGTSFDALDLAEDRGRFSTMLADMGIPYPEFSVAETVEDSMRIAEELGFPLLVRPSYVIGGQSMKIVINKNEMRKHVLDIFRLMPENKVLLDRFLEDAIEAEADAVCDGENVEILGIMQHLEPAGIHSGDSHSVLPPYNLGDLIMQQIVELTKKIALKMSVKGLLNVQFAIKDDIVYVIEANPRASRTVPFIAKTYKRPYVNYAVKCMLGGKVLDYNFKHNTSGYAIKEPVFSYNKFPEINKELGPEMKSTGEAIYFIKNLKDSKFKKLYSERNLYLSK